MAQHKIKSLTDAQTQITLWQQEGLNVVFTNGCFDILHAGHVTYLEEAKTYGDKLIIGLNSDRSVRSIKGGKRPIIGEQDRALLLSGLEAVDMVVLFDEDTPIDLLKTLKPNLQVKGGDYRKEDLPEYPIIKEYGGDVKILSFKPGCSTSGIIEKILNN